MNNLINDYSCIGLVNIEKVPAKALHDIRDNLRGEVVIRMFKKKIIRRAFEQTDKKNLMELLDSISGLSSLIFTNMDPIKVAEYMEEQAVTGYAKGGDIAPIEILVKAGDTGLLPGPIISELSQHLKVAPMTKDGTIHIRQDKVTHKPGDVIEEKQAQLLARLDIKPITIKLDFYCAWQDGSLIPDEVLHLDREAIFNKVILGASQAMNLALNLEFITPQTVEPLTIKAFQNARALALELPIFFPELMDSYIAKAVSQATVLNAAALGLELPSAGGSSSNDDNNEPEPESEEEEKEDEAPAGLGALFG